MIKKTLLLLMVIFSGCTNKQKTWDEQNVRELEISDPDVKRAMSLAQDNIDDFVQSFTSNSQDTTWKFYIKHGIRESSETEHMWFVVTAVENGINAVLDNIPQTVTSINYGDTIVVKKNEIEDFLIYRGDTLVFGDFLNIRIN